MAKCKNPVCEKTFTHEQHITDWVDDPKALERFEKGFIRCPHCQGNHQVLNVRLFSKGARLYEWGDYVP